MVSALWISVLWFLRCGLYVVDFCVVVSALWISALWFQRCGFCAVASALWFLYVSAWSLRFAVLMIFDTMVLVITSCLIRLYIIGSTILYSIEFVSLF